MKNIKADREGSIVYIENLFLPSGTGIDDLKKEEKKKPKLIWIIIPMILFIGLTFSLWLNFNLSPSIYALNIIIDFLVIFWIASAIQLRFKDKWVSTACVLFFLFVLSVSAGWVGWNEAADTFWNNILQKKLP